MFAAASVLVLMAGVDAPTLSLENEGPRFDELDAPVRFHGEISAAAFGGFTPIPAAGGAAGLHLELGFVTDNHIFSLRASGGSVRYFTGFQFGLSFAERITSRVSLGLGLTWGGIIGISALGLGGWLGVQVPVRLAVLIGPSSRRGLMLGFELAPGAAHAAWGDGLTRAKVPQLTISGQLTIGYAVW